MTNETHNQMLLIEIEVVPSDVSQADPAVVSKVARELAASLRVDGYTVQPAYTREKGGSLYDIVMQGVQLIHDNKELLTSLTSLATPIVAHLLKKREERAATEQPIEITIEVGGGATTLQAIDAESDATLLARLLSDHPDLPTTMTPQSVFKIKVGVPPKAARRRS